MDTSPHHCYPSIPTDITAVEYRSAVSVTHGHTCPSSPRSPQHISYYAYCFLAARTRAFFVYWPQTPSMPRGWAEGSHAATTVTLARSGMMVALPLNEYDLLRRQRLSHVTLCKVISKSAGRIGLYKGLHSLSSQQVHQSNSARSLQNHQRRHESC
jgi:hypothetical protein